MTDSTNDHSEKRDFIRLKVDTEIFLKLADTDRTIKGYCKDLSGTGMLIEVDESVSEGVTCKTTLPSNSDAFPSLEASLKILRCTALEDNKYLLGMEILDIQG